MRSRLPTTAFQTYMICSFLAFEAPIICSSSLLNATPRHCHRSTSFRNSLSSFRLASSCTRDPCFITCTWSKISDSIRCIQAKLTDSIRCKWSRISDSIRCKHPRQSCLSLLLLLRLIWEASAPVCCLTHEQYVLSIINNNNNYYAFQLMMS